MDDEAAPAEIAHLGDFFVLDAAETSGPWRPAADLLDGGVLAERVEMTRSALSRIAQHDVNERVAASTASLGLFARLMSPSVGAELLDVQGPAPAGLQWRSSVSGPIPLRSGVWMHGSLAAILSDLVEPLAALLVAQHSLSENVVRGNVASAVMGSLKMAVAARPDLADRATSLGDELLASAFLAGTSWPGSPFVRRSCCLYYRVPGGGYCGDCVLAPQHRARVAAARWSGAPTHGHGRSEVRARQSLEDDGLG